MNTCKKCGCEIDDLEGYCNGCFVPENHGGLKVHGIVDPFSEGSEAFLGGMNMRANPYRVNSEEWREWVNGWAAAKHLGRL
jgi:hypothetical protein